jgi:hypothetical protein
MRYYSLKSFLSDGGDALREGPVAIILVEDLVEVETTIRHHLHLGFKSVIVLAPEELELTELVESQVHRVTCLVNEEGAMLRAVNAICAAAPGLWFFYCYNAEYLFFPFCETRSIGEMLHFHAEERRDAMLSYVVDLYAGDLGEFPNAVTLEDAHLDRSGYYALGRHVAENNHDMKERQLDFYGGLRWRFEEHIPVPRRRIDRVSLFRAQKGVTLLPGHVFSDEEYNTYACRWHHNLTAAVASFRTAKALRSNSGSRAAIDTFKWHNSVPFDWHSQQLLDLGLMEPGQWF